MYTWDIKVKKSIRTAFVYLLVSLFCILFGAVYELFSHEVYSYYMIYAFVFPLAGGSLPFCTLCLTRSSRYPCTVARELYHTGIATLTVGSIVQGILEIYGTSSSLIDLYWYIGPLFTLSGIAYCFIQWKKEAK